MAATVAASSGASRMLCADVDAVVDQLFRVPLIVDVRRKTQMLLMTLVDRRRVDVRLLLREFTEIVVEPNLDQGRMPGGHLVYVLRELMLDVFPRVICRADRCAPDQTEMTMTVDQTGITVLPDKFNTLAAALSGEP